jgi:hypothetical protein
LPITSILGISLLGMRARQRVPLVKSDGSIGGVWLDAVSADAGRPRAAEEASASRPDAGRLAESRPCWGETPSYEEKENVLLFRPAQPGGRPVDPDDPDPADGRLNRKHIKTQRKNSRNA